MAFLLFANNNRLELARADLQIKPLQRSFVFHIETSHLVRYVNEMTSFYIKCNTELKWFNGSFLL